MSEIFFWMMVWVASCLLVGVIADSHKLGFGQWVLIGVLTSPLLSGLALWLTLRARERAR